MTQKADTADTPPQSGFSGFVRANNFVNLYANNFQIEQTAFDLRINLGELAGDNSHYVEQRASLTIPWVTAKMLIYYLQVHIASFELVNGKIQIRSDLIPKPIEEPPQGQENDAQIRELFKTMEELRQKFVSSL